LPARCLRAAAPRTGRAACRRRARTRRRRLALSGATRGRVNRHPLRFSTLAVARAFDDFDANGDGVIDANELRARARSCALLLPRIDIDAGPSMLCAC
jgi:hypothetical protein